ncbi:MAG: hypothetical protein JW928_01185 [Candidatus Aureabacteria bacterium]|nr:hypothetical protein [Candidatus Auribacterota bacterium]
MKILYGVQTTGNGHIVRSTEIIKGLRSLGHDIHVVLSGRPKKKTWSRDIFHPAAVRRGLTFITENGKVKYLRTAFQLDILRFYRDIFSFKANDFDLVVTDYEPITARIAMLRRIPSIGVGHLYAFLYKVPVAGFDPIGRAVLKCFAPARYTLGLHWHHFGEPLLPPSIPKDIMKREKTIQDKILVYLPFENLDEIEKFLHPYKNYHFYIYWKVEEPLDEGNLHLRPFSRTGFIKDLADCSGVFGNAGFSLTSEALHLGKRILVKPLSGQIEQRSNALALERLGLGNVMRRHFDHYVMERWLKSPPLKSCEYPDVFEHIVRWIHEGRWEDVQTLSRELWKKVKNC